MCPEMIPRDTVVKVNMNTLRENMRKIRDMNGPDVHIMAVVKANAYGHGARQVSKTLVDSGAVYLAVATLTEALELRDESMKFPIFILGHTPDRLLDIVIDKNITQTIFSYEQASIMDSYAKTKGKTCKVHIKIDTGMHRLGMIPSKDAEEEILKMSQLPNLEIEGIFSHLALTDKAENEAQFKRFMDFVGLLEDDGIEFKYKHIADSIACVDYPEYRLNMVRPGALIYGMHSFHINYISVEPAITLETRISQFHKLKPGEYVGYDSTWRASRESLIATLPVGYVDGIPRNVGHDGHVSVDGKRAPIVGMICMDQCMIDVTDIADVNKDSSIIIYGSGKDGSMTFKEVSDLLNINKNDLMCRLGGRPPHIYYNEIRRKITND